MTGPSETTRSPLVERLRAPGPKRILSLDGGGIRGLITLGYLGEIERILRARYRREDLVLSDYFDLIGGTSTGAIIAAALALGWSVERVSSMYISLANDIFQPKRSVLGPLARLVGAKFDAKPLEKILKREIGNMRLDSEDLRTGLVVITKRADTASVWQLTNVPDHRFYEMNRHMKVWEILRASSAAPTYFAPQRIKDVGDGESGVFVDGAVSMHSNPALQMLMIANLEGFGLEWPLGADRVLLCSVGTGAYNVAPAADKMKGYRQVQWLGLLMVQLMRDASHLGETMLQWMSKSPTAHSIDRQIGALDNDLLAPAPLLSYLRYDVDLTVEGTQALGLDWSESQVSELKAMAETRFVERLAELGRRAATHHVEAGHLGEEFDPEPLRQGGTQE